jgi:DNA-binding TFAR19-related protein (PDSD5 family)
MKKTIVISLAAVVCLVSILIGAETKKAVKPLRVGVYDSRAIAIACLRTEWWNNQVQEKMKEMEKAKAAGDTKKVKELEEWGQSSQAKAHLQGFGTAPVKNLLERIKDQLPGVAQQVGVDIIVNKWQIDYQIKDAELVDVTDAIVALYKPSEETLKILEEMKKQPPVAEEELLKMKD